MTDTRKIIACGRTQFRASQHVSASLSTGCAAQRDWRSSRTLKHALVSPWRWPSDLARHAERRASSRPRHRARLRPTTTTSTRAAQSCRAASAARPPRDDCTAAQDPSDRTLRPSDRHYRARPFHQYQYRCAGVVRNVRETDSYTRRRWARSSTSSTRAGLSPPSSQRTLAKALGYDPGVWVQHKLQAEVDAAGLKLRVTVEAA
jgi:hypothetical protein